MQLRGAILLAIVFYIGLPALTIMGWYFWARGTKAKGVCSTLSFIGFLVATISVLLAISSIAFAHLIGGFPFHDPRLMKIYRWGFLLSLTAILFSVGGL
jgi:nicotinamide riboside transporter PnuC